MKIKDIEVLENVNLKSYNTYKIESYAKYLIKIKDISSLIDVLKKLKEEEIPYYIYKHLLFFK